MEKFKNGTKVVPDLAPERNAYRLEMKTYHVVNKTTNIGTSIIP